MRASARLALALTAALVLMGLGGCCCVKANYPTHSGDSPASASPVPSPE